MPPRAFEVPSCLCLHDDFWFVGPAIRSFLPAGPATAFVSRTAWNGTPGDWERCAEEAERAGAEVVLGDWPDESMHRRHALAAMRERGHSHLLIPDGDEVASPELLRALLKIAEADLSDLVRVRMDTYWKDACHVIRPREELAPILMLDCRSAEHLRIREYAGRRLLVLNEDHGLLHHLSYAGPDRRIGRKIATWGHRHELAEAWYERVWRGWDRDPLLRDLHPTHPPFYGFAERIEAPEALAGVEAERAELGDPAPFPGWPSVSVVIPLYGGEDDVRACLASLEACRDLLAEVVVVDDVSPDGAAEVVEAEFPWATLLRNERNVGFAGTCDAGYDASSGECVVFLNSDTRVPRAGLVRLVGSLWESEAVAASGPLSNSAGGCQGIVPTYTDVSRLDLFARDLAHRDVPDDEVSMLVGLCLACRRSALDALGEPPFDERFGRGLFEDNDLCHRLLRAGFRLRLANRAYVHHEGSKSLGRAGEEPGRLFARNLEVFREKWREDVETGFVSHLPGLGSGPVVFDPERSPERRRERIAALASQADVSLCMIVRDEERVLGACLASVQGAFPQTVVVDTGSADRTVEIARAHGAEVHEIAWPESFAAARNESLRHARGRWVLWLDADDTVPLGSLEAILSAAAYAPEDVSAFVVPVQFVEEGPGMGTRVDHVKLFRNLSGVAFEGRIHEQVLSSLRAVLPQGRIERIPGAAVLHSGYDTSPEGQARKAARDERLLALDLADRPEHPFVLFNLGMTAHYRAGHPEAANWLRRSVRAAQPGESHVRKAYALLAVSLRESEGPQAALAAVDEGLAAVGPDPELLFHRGALLARLGRPDEAREAYLAMPLDPSPWFTSLDVGILGFKRSHNLGEACLAAGRYPEARDWFRRALAESPGMAASAEALFDAALEREDLRTADEALDALRTSIGSSRAWAERAAALAEAKGLGPDALLLEAARRSPDPSGPGLVLARRLLERGETRGAEPILRSLEVAGSAEAAFLRGVLRTREGEFDRALLHMRRALRLDPGHAQTAEQVRALEAALGDAPPVPRVGLDVGERDRILSGPHAGRLGPANRNHSVVVVTYNSARTLAACLGGVLPELGPDDELIVVDNASSDETVSELESLLAGDGRARVVRNDSNVGYARAANAGILASGGRCVTLLNPDTEPSSGWIEGLASRIDMGYAAAGPSSDRVAEPQFVVRFLEPDDRPPLEDLPARLAATIPGFTVPTPLLMGLCLTLSREVLDRHGLLDEDAELGADDLELSWRLRALGYRLAVAADVFVRHDAGASFASLPDEERLTRIRGSDAALRRKLERYYGLGTIPSSKEIWRNDVFQAALDAA